MKRLGLFALSVVLLAIPMSLAAHGSHGQGGRGSHGKHHLFRYTDKMLPPAERFFAHHGGKAVFLARFIPGLRVIGALVAGIAGMEWWRFLVWNVAGGVVWATSVALITYCRDGPLRTRAQPASLAGP